MTTERSATTERSDGATSWTLQTLLQQIARYGERPALITVAGDRRTQWSHAELADHAARLAGGMRREGIAPGEPVLLMGQNSPEWVVVRLALGACGALAVPCDHLSSREEVETVLRDSGCRRAFVASSHVAMLRESEGGREVAVHLLDDAAEGNDLPSWRALLGDGEVELPALDSAAPTVLVYTSGTTGRPKSFTLNSANIWANVGALVAENFVGSEDCVLLPLPLHHVYPFVVGLLVPLANGAAVVFPEGVAGPQIVEALRAGGVTTIVGVPRLYAAVVTNLESQVTARGRLARLAYKRLLALSIALRRHLGWHAGRVLFRPLLSRIGPKLRLLVSGGAALQEQLVWTLEGLGWEVRNGYGLAETASTFTGNLPGRERIGSEGRPFQGGEVRIGDPDGSGIGEIHLRGPNVFEGYRDNPEANREAFTADGWFRTGDLGALDGDGYLYFKGRTKELIVLGGGKNVFPEQLERAYGESPFIHEIALLERNGALHALVRPNTEAIMESGTTRIDDSLRVALGSVGQHLPSHQRLAGYIIVREPLPRTRLGKYRRFLLPDLYERALSGREAAAPAELSPEDRRFLERPLAAEVWRLLKGRYPDRPLGLDASLQLDLGVDSLEWITLGLELERRLGVRLSEAEAAEIGSVRDLVTAVEKAAQRPAADLTPEASPEELVAERKQWTRPGHFGHALLGAVLFAVNRILMKSLFRLKTDGLTKLPPPGPLVIVANHVSDLDPLAVAGALPLRYMRRAFWGGDVARLFSGPVKRFLCRVLHIFPVDERSPGASLALAREVLAQDNLLIWFPEAWRSPTGELQRFLPGIGSLVEKSGATAVPAYIGGTYDAMPRWVRFPRPHAISVTFGEPLGPEQLMEGEGDTPAERITRALEDAIAGLAPPSQP